MRSFFKTIIWIQVDVVAELVCCLLFFFCERDQINTPVCMDRLPSIEILS